ncbi:MAG: LysM peptidoglycan-binding domain-containing protein [Flavobacteriales bacterium]
MKKLIFSVFSMLVFCLLFAADTQAQVVGPVEQYKGVEVYSHSVEKGQTLYSLCKFYQVDINDVLNLNPDADKKLNEGQILYIPVAKSGIKPRTSPSTNEEFIRHEVKRKETLYSISKEYNVDINRLIELNPGADQGLKKGQEILIPTKKKGGDNSIKTTPTETPTNYHKHTVVQGETLFALSRSYHVPVDAIKDANPGMSESLKPGQVINIPVKAQPNDQSVVKPTTFDSLPNFTPVNIPGSNVKDSYTISLLLPFFSNEADTSLTDKERVYRDAAINMYRGVNLALDTLKKIGFKADVYVREINGDKSDARKILSEKAIKESDLFIGPAFKEPLQEISAAAEANGAHIVVPFPTSNRVLLISNNMSKACPSEETQWEFMGRYIADHHTADNVLLVNSGVIDDARAVQVFGQSYLSVRGDSVITLKMVKNEIVGLTSMLSKSRRNVLVVPTADKKTINALFAGIDGYTCLVYGDDEWENMRNVKADYRNDYHIRFPKTIFLDYTDPAQQKWIEAYRKHFKTEPTDFAVLGYNMMMYYAEGLMQFGKDFPNHFAEIKTKGLVGTGFNYLKTGNESGFENRYCIILESDDFDIKIVK